MKHFAAYGAVIAGRDYNAVDMSDITLRQVYLPPYQAAVDAGAATVMSSFNSLNSVPATADPYTLTDILRKEWHFDGFVVSDWGAVGELMAHGIALNNSVAAQKAIDAGLDMDMESGAYYQRLVALVRTNAVSQATVDQAVRRVLRVKFALGIFDHPYVDENRPPYQATPEKRALARKAAEESIVLLQNQPREGQPDLLPIAAHVHTIALIGPLADSQNEMLGSWGGQGNPADAVTLRTALEQRMQAHNGKVLYAEGTQILTTSQAGFEAAKQAAQQADLVIMALGEDAPTMTGEAASRAHLDLPGNQEQLLQAIAATGKPVVLIVFSGRPLVLDWASQHVPAILEAWYPGIEAGPALVDILFGNTNPSAKLPVSFPRAVGQEPLYLAQMPTGRPATGVDLSRPPANTLEKYVSRYIDVPTRRSIPSAMASAIPRLLTLPSRSPPIPCPWRGSCRLQIRAPLNPPLRPAPPCATPVPLPEQKLSSCIFGFEAPALKNRFARCKAFSVSICSPANRKPSRSHSAFPSCRSSTREVSASSSPQTIPYSSAEAPRQRRAPPSRSYSNAVQRMCSAWVPPHPSRLCEG